MISFAVKMKFSPEDRTDVAESLRELAAASRQEPGCVNYVPHHVDGDPDTVVIYEQYADQAAVEAHRASRHFEQYAVGGLYQLMKDREIEILDALA